MYDGDQNQYLVKKDFEKIAIKIAEVKNIGSRSPKLVGLKERYARVWKSLSSEADGSGDKKVCLSEWLAYYDLNDYPLPPVNQILAFLAWMAEN